jgi:hypothetical protein
MRKDSIFDKFDWIAIPSRTIKFGLLTLVVGTALFVGVYAIRQFKDTLINAIQQPIIKPDAPEIKEQRFARITNLAGDVKVKKVNKVNWVSAREVDHLQEGDLLQTESGSSATIIFFDNSTYTVNPDSLVSIQKSQENLQNSKRKVALEVTSGTVDLTTSKRNVDGSSSEIQTPNASVSLDEFTTGRAKHDKKTKDSEFSIFQGGADVITRGDQASRIRLGPNERVGVDPNNRLSEKTTLPSPPALLEPKNFGWFVTADPKNFKIKLKWEQVPTAKLYRLRVATTSSFSPLLLNQVLSESGYELKGLDYGAHYWRVDSLDDKGMESPPADVFSFTVTPKRASGPAKYEISIDIEKIVPFGHNFQVIGKTDPGIMIFINDEIVEVKGDGSFKHFTKPFKTKGKNELVIVGRDLAGVSKTIREPVEVR